MSLYPITNYKLCIICTTYNHASFILDTMNGFSSQKTNFPFVAIIVDDASTDGESSIISSYLNKNFDMANARFEENEDAVITAAIHNNNHNCHFLILLLKYNFYSIKKEKYTLYKDWFENVPYMALCEGDDYWTDSNKLQKQVNFLENNLSYSMCYHPVLYKENGKTVSDDKRFDTDKNIEVNTLIENGGAYCATCSLVYRREFAKEYTKYRRIANVGDWPLQIQLGIKGKVRYLSSIMGVYRVNHPGSWTNTVMNKDYSKPFSNNIEWLMAFNDETHKKYDKSVLKTILPFMGYLVDKKIKTHYDLARLLRKFKIKSIISTSGWKTLLFAYFPSVYLFIKKEKD